MSTEKNIRFRARMDNASNWAAKGGTLLNKELGIDYTNRIIKYGNNDSSPKTFADAEILVHPGDAYMTWGGKHLAQTASPLDVALCKEYRGRGNLFAFLNASNVTVEYSNDGGATWIEQDVTDKQKKQLFTLADTNPTTYVYLGGFTNNIVSSQGRVCTTNDMTRITLDKDGIYGTIEKFLIDVSNSSFNYGHCVKIETIRNGKDVNDESQWVTRVSDAQVSGWSGYNTINTAFTFGGTHTAYDQKIRFTFYQTKDYVDPSGTYCGALAIQGIYAYGISLWTAPSKQARYGRLYGIDLDQGAHFPGLVRATTLQIGNQNGNIVDALGSAAIGNSNEVQNSYSLAVGQTHKIASSYSLSVGRGNYVGGEASGAIGKGLYSHNAFGLAIGSYNLSNARPFSIGNGTSDTDRNNMLEVDSTGSMNFDTNIKIGTVGHPIVSAEDLSSAAEDKNGVYIGKGVTGYGTGGVAIGAEASVKTFGVAIGTSATNQNRYSTVIGGRSSSSGAGKDYNVVIGTYASSAGACNTIVGPFSTTEGDDNIIVGYNSSTESESATTAGNTNILIGNRITPTDKRLHDAIVVGHGSSTSDTSYSQIIIGNSISNTGDIANIAIGSPITAPYASGFGSIGINGRAQGYGSCAFLGGATSPYSIALGSGAYAQNPNNISDTNNYFYGDGNTAIGHGSAATGIGNIALGGGSSAGNDDDLNQRDIAIGPYSESKGTNTIAMGFEAKSATESNFLGNIAIGAGTSSETDGGIAIGVNAKVNDYSNISNGNIAIGKSASVYCQGVAIGDSAHSEAGVAIGDNAIAYNGICIGNGSDAGLDNFVIGNNISSNYTRHGSTVINSTTANGLAEKGLNSISLGSPYSNDENNDPYGDPVSTPDDTFQVWHLPLLNRITGKIPEERLPDIVKPVDDSYLFDITTVENQDYSGSSYLNQGKMPDGSAYTITKDSSNNLILTIYPDVASSELATESYSLTMCSVANYKVYQYGFWNNCLYCLCGNVDDKQGTFTKYTWSNFSDQTSFDNSKTIDNTTYNSTPFTTGSYIATMKYYPSIDVISYNYNNQYTYTFFRTDTSKTNWLDEAYTFGARGVIGLSSAKQSSSASLVIANTSSNSFVTLDDSYTLSAAFSQTISSPVLSIYGTTSGNTGVHILKSNGEIKKSYPNMKSNFDYIDEEFSFGVKFNTANNIIYFYNLNTNKCYIIKYYKSFNINNLESDRGALLIRNDDNTITKIKLK